MFDIHSETIAHFIGHFELLVERAGMRLDYDRLSHAAREIDDPPPLPDVKVKVSSELGLDDFAPGAIRLGFGPDVPDGGAAASGGRGGSVDSHASSGGPSGAPAADVPGISGGGGIFSMLVAKAIYLLDPPSQLGVVTLQANFASDQDMWLNGAVFPAGSLPALISFDALRADLGALVALAGQLSPFAPISAAASAAEIIGSLAPALAAANPGLLPAGAAVTMLRLGDPIDPDDPDSEAFGGGLVVDGVVSDEVPDYLAQRLEARQEENTKVDAVGGNSGTDPLPQEVSTGENLLLNETALGSDWLDAPVIAVAGDVTSLTLIAQVNLLSDRDSVSVSGEGGVQLAAYPGEGGSASAPEGMVLNVASLTEVSNVARAQLLAEARKAQAQDDAAKTGEEPETVLPEAWAVTRIDGDLLIDTWTLQVNLLSDDDVAQFAAGGHGMQVDLGDNVLVNLSSLLALGTYYDLIMVGGNMIDLTSVQQANILLDNDNVLLMGGQDGSAPQGIGNLSTHGNALWNEAHVEKIGIDYHAALSEGFEAALKSLADGIDDLSSIMSDALFEGFEFLRVLYIEGDLIRTDTITQVNILGDSDQVAVLADNFAQGGLLPLDLTTGENILANMATLKQAGLDSTVMAGGEVYTDAVIWQAGMIDTNDHPLEGGMGALASEAVAFLADGMIDPVVPSEVELTLTPEGCGSGSVDVMHSVLT